LQHPQLASLPLIEATHSQLPAGCFFNRVPKTVQPVEKRRSDGDVRSGVAMLGSVA
jgi:hypothetical protein